MWSVEENEKKWKSGCPVDDNNDLTMTSDSSSNPE